MTRHVWVRNLRSEKLEEYKKYHAAVWPELLDMIRECNIRNYSIHYRDGTLFGYFEYVGDDYEADMAKLDASPINQRWQRVMEPFFIPFEGEEETWFEMMEEVFYTD